MQGVVTKTTILRNPFVVIRHFGFSVFWEVLKAPSQCTFLEIIARHDFNKRRGEELKRVRALDKAAKRLQSRALAQSAFDSTTLALLEANVALSHDAQALRDAHPRAKAAVNVAAAPDDPLMRRFQQLMGALIAADQTIRAALGTLSPNELLAVETRVLKATQKRLKDEFEQTMQHATTQLELGQAKMLAKFFELGPEARRTYLAKMSAPVRILVTARAGDAEPPASV